MEMHQVRYFLAVTRTLNFTRAADECNVTQPSLTRAIKQLEAELGGDLFRRERPAAQLTELGHRMHPLLQQCYDAASGARMLAASFKGGEVGALRIALTHSIDLSLLIPHLDQIKRQFNRLEFRFLRGNAAKSASTSRRAKPNSALPLKSARTGTGSIPGRCSPRISSSSSTSGILLAGRDTIDVGDLRAEQLLSRNYCEHCRPGECFAARARARGRAQPRNLLGARPDRTARSRYRHRRRPRHLDDPADAETRHGRRARCAPHRAPLRCRGPRANRGRLRRDAHAARRGLATIHREESGAIRVI